MTRTNNQGYYEFPLLPAGEYVIRVQQPGFRPAESASFALNTGTRPRIDLALSLGAVNESIQVVAAAPLVNATTTDLGIVIDNRKIESLPLNGRNFQQLVGLQAGTLSSPPTAVGQRGGIEFNGSSAYGNNLMLDGIDMTFGEDNAASGAEGGKPKINTVSIEALEEFKATGSSFSAEYGRASGGVLNLTTKSGTNKFHGTLFEFLRNDAFDANSFFSNSAGLKKPPLRWNQFGGNVGGPIRRDRIFFFFNYEGARIRQNQQFAGNVPTPFLLAQVKPAIRDNLSGLPTLYTLTADPNLGFARRNAVNTDNENTYLYRVDGQFGAHRLSLRYSHNQQDLATPTFEAGNTTIYPQRLDNAAFQDSFTISPSMFNEFRIGINRNDLDRHDSSIQTRPGLDGLTVSAWGTTSGNQSRIDFTTTTYNMADNFSVIRGRHTWKFGFEIRELRSYRYQTNNSTVNYQTTADLIADKAQNITVRFGGGRSMKDRNYGFFGQDEWRVSRRLQLNLGLRYEYYPPLVGTFNIQSSDPYGPFDTSRFDPMFAPDRNNFAPRAGLVMDLNGKHTLVLRTGGGIGYVPSQPFFFYNNSFTDPRLPYKTTLAPSDLPGVSFLFPFPQAYLDTLQANPNLLGPNITFGRSTADYNARTEYSGQWNFTLQGALSQHSSLQASYVGSRGLKLLGERMLNNLIPGLGVRARPDIGPILHIENAGNSTYHALQVAFHQKEYKGITLDSYYTWARSMGYYLPDSNYNADFAIQDPDNIAGSYGPRQSDIRHNFVAVHSYTLPGSGFLRNSRFGRTAIGGWSLQGIWNWRSGLPFNVTAGKDLIGNGRSGPQRPDVVAGVSPYISDAQSLTWLNKAAFDIVTPQKQVRFGDLGYNALRGPSGLSLDAALHKAFIVREQQRLVFRLELFNAMNHKILDAPVGNASNPSFGKIISASGGRNIQLALKYLF
jgi:hypothetical protein